MVDLMADDEKDFLQREFAQEQRVGMKHRRKPIQQNARDAAAGELYVIGQIHQKIAVIAVPLGNEEQLHQLQHMDAIGFDFIQYRSAALALLDGGNIQFHIRQQLDDIRLHSEPRSFLSKILLHQRFFQRFQLFEALLHCQF